MVLAYATNDLVFNGLLQASDGNLYGNAINGVSGDGMLFRITTNGTGFTYLYTNTAGLDPAGTLVQANNGFLLGTTYTGGTSNLGTIIRSIRTVKIFKCCIISAMAQWPTMGLHRHPAWYLPEVTIMGPPSTEEVFWGTVRDHLPDSARWQWLHADLFFLHQYLYCVSAISSCGCSHTGIIPGKYGRTFWKLSDRAPCGNGGVYGLLINPPATITPVSSTSGGETTVTWPAWASSFTLQSTTNLFSGSWQGVTNGTPIIGQQVPATNSQIFYRLVSPQ